MIKKLIGILLLGHLSLFAATRGDEQDEPDPKRPCPSASHQGASLPAKPVATFSWVLDGSDGMRYNPGRAKEAQTFWERLVYNVVEQTRESPTSTTPKPSIHSDPRQYARSVSVPEWPNLPVTYSLVPQNPLAPYDASKAQENLLGTNRVCEWLKSLVIVLRGVKPMGPPSSGVQQILQMSIPVKHGFPGKGEDSVIRITIATHGLITLQDNLPPEDTMTYGVGWGLNFDFSHNTGLFSTVSMGLFSDIKPPRDKDVNALVAESSYVKGIARLNGFQITYP